MSIPTHDSLPVVSAYGVYDVGMTASLPSRGTTGSNLAPNEFGSARRTPGRPNTFYGVGTNNRSSSTGELLNSMQNLRT